jgi:hypothetical protein
VPVALRIASVCGTFARLFRERGLSSFRYISRLQGSQQSEASAKETLTGKKMDKTDATIRAFMARTILSELTIPSPANRGFFIARRTVSRHKRSAGLKPQSPAPNPKFPPSLTFAR